MKLITFETRIQLDNKFQYELAAAYIANKYGYDEYLLIPRFNSILLTENIDDAKNKKVCDTIRYAIGDTEINIYSISLDFETEV